MYRKCTDLILMHKYHRFVHQILWRDNEHKLSAYQLNTVTYGTTAAPYLAIQCINQLAMDNEELFLVASSTIQSDFYVDDLLTGSDDITALQTSCKEISSILKSGNLILRKWISNNPSILENIEFSDIANEIVSIGECNF